MTPRLHNAIMHMWAHRYDIEAPDEVTKDIPGGVVVDLGQLAVAMEEATKAEKIRRLTQNDRQAEQIRRLTRGRK